jgi:sporulation protein YlmC with PRC-barrel domain
MGHDYRMVGAAVIAAAMLGAAGLSSADDRDGLLAHRQVAQAINAPVESPAGRGAGEAAATVIDQQDVQGILGRQVLSSAGEDMGRVIDVVVDRSGQVRAAVIDFGGFLGVGNRKVAVDWNALRFAPTGSKYDRITLDLTRDQVKAAPEYKDGKPLVVLGAADSLPSSPPPH